MARPPDRHPDSAGFAVDLPVFHGPFDLLLQLIARRELEVTEVALAQVTDEFIEHMAQVPDLSAATEFLVVAATLLDMKAASLLPRTESQNELIDEDLSARDLLFSRLLQYRAFRQMGSVFAQKMESERLSVAREVPLEPHFAALLPELVWSVTKEQLAMLVVNLLVEPPRADEAEHVARPKVSVAQQVQILREFLRKKRQATFLELISDAGDPAVVIGRFLGILELYRQGLVAFDQSEPFGELEVMWEGENEQ